MANIRPALYIGIGGTGITAIAKTKKMFEEAYGKTGLHRLPVRFICIDYDLASEKDTKNATDISEDFVQITNLASPRRLYREQRKNGRFNWFYPQNARFMDDKISDGAAQVRGYGRFLTEMIIDEIKTKIDNAIDQITQLSQDLQEQNTNISKVDCHVVMSIAGGTGCGSFLNVAWALRKKQEVNIIGYGVLHSVFRAIDPTRNQTPRVVSNAYSAVLDLDYLMNATEANPIRLSLNLLERDLTQPIYDQFYVIDNKTTDNRTVTDCGSLCDVIATCLFSAGGSPGEKVNAIMNNVGWNKGGDYSIMHKNGWTQGLGACQIIYDGESLADIYADKAAIEIIKQLRNSDTDVAQTAIAWTEDNNVREDGDQYNYLIDSIYSPSKLRGLSSPDVDVKATMTDTRETVKVYLNSNHDFPNEDTTLLLQNTLCEALKKSVDAMLNKKHGVGNALTFLSALKKRLSDHKGEMQVERNQFLEKVKTANDTLEYGFKEYEVRKKKLVSFRGPTKEESLEENVSIPAREVLICKMEAARREVAEKIFTNLLSLISELEEQVNTLDSKLQVLSKDISSELMTKQYASTYNSLFQIDLSADLRVKMQFDSNDVKIDDYFAWLNKSLLSVDTTTNELKDSFYYFTRNLKEDGVDRYGQKQYVPSDVIAFRQYEAYKNMLLNDVIEELKAKDRPAYEKLKDQIEALSSCLLRVDDRGVMDAQGRTPSQKQNRVFLINYYGATDAQNNQAKSPFEGDKRFSDKNVAFIPNDSPYYRQRMIFYRSNFAIIPYCIAAFKEIAVDEYDVAISQSQSEDSRMPHPHFDKQLFEEMRKRDFKLKPEMKNEAMFYWICGNILDFGWKPFVEKADIMEKDANGHPIKKIGSEEVTHNKYIRFYKGKYQYWDESAKAQGGEKWISLNTADRKLAYDYFKAECFSKLKPILSERIKQLIQEKGKNYYDMKINEIIAAGMHDYIDKEAIGNKNSATIDSGKGSNDSEQYNEEWNYIENELMNAFDNIKTT